MKSKITYFISAALLSLTGLNAQTTYNYYFGNIHSQTSYSDGNKDASTSLMTTPLQAFNYANASQHIDFYGISEHNHSTAGMTNLADWHNGVADANTANSDGSFIALYGQEWGEISTGGHVIVYGYDSLMGWDAGLYDVYVAQNDYTTLFNKIKARNGAFAYLAHPQATDYSNMFTNAYSVNVDKAVIGMAARSGPAFSTNTSYSNPSTSDFTARYDDALKMGYHVGIGLDHDTHYSVFGRQSAGRLVVLATSLTRANILDAFLNMRMYSSDDWNAKVDFNISSQPMGSVFQHAGSPTIKVNITDADVETTSSIQIYYGVPGSGTTCTVLGSNSGSSTYSITPTITNGSTYYYYAKITQSDGDVIWTSPIWYTRNDAATAVPTAVFSTASNTVCAGQTINLTDNSTNTPTSWNWTMTSATPATSTLQNPTVTYNAAGTYTVTLVSSNSGGSSSPVSKVITVKASPNVTATNATICNGQSAIITVSSATTYSWSTGVTTSSISVSPASTTIYSVTGTSNGCSKTITTTVTVNAIPSLTSSSASICNGQSATISASGATTYSWSTGVTTATISTSPSTTTTYTVKGTSNGCSKTITTTVTVNAIPNVNSGSSTICSGQSAVVSASGATTYSWNTGATTSSISVTPASSTVYSVTGTSNGCSKTITTTVTVNAIPNVNSTSSSICSGQSATITSSGATTYLWNTGVNTQSMTVSPTTTTVYTVTGTNSSGCTKSSTSTVTVNALPNIATTASQNNLCSGQSTVLSASGATSYTWSTNAGSVTTSSASVSPITNTTYTVTGSNGNCSAANTIAITVNATPTAPAITQSAGVLSSSSSTGNQWYLNGNIIAGATGQTYTPTQNGNYTVVVTSGGCSSATSTAYSYNTTGIAVATNGIQVDLYPNPNNGQFDLKIDLSKGDNYTLQIVNALGQIVHSEKPELRSGHFEKHLDISIQGAGLYYFILRNDKDSFVRKVIVY
jgi:hypothetical protein